MRRDLATTSQSRDSKGRRRVDETALIRVDSSSHAMAKLAFQRPSRAPFKYPGGNLFRNKIKWPGLSYVVGGVKAGRSGKCRTDRMRC